MELAVVLVAGGLVAAAAARVLNRQQRFYANASTLVEQRVQLRDAVTILSAELRALAPRAGDVLAFSDSALDIRATIGAAIACDTLPGGMALDLAPARLANGTQLAAFTTTSQPGDVALVSVLDADASDGDAWASAEVGSVTLVENTCPTSPLLDAVADAAARRLRLTFATGARLPDTVRPGAFVRVVRHVRYRFYRAGTGAWYLGFAEWDGSTFGVVQPVSGPFASHSHGGLELRYYAETGDELTAGDDGTHIARVTVLARADRPANLAGGSGAAPESQHIGVRIRNR